MKHLSRTLSLISAALGTMIFVRIRSELTLFLVPLKLIATALSGWLTIFGIIGTWLGLLRSDPVAMFLSAFGALSGAHYIRAVTHPHTDFAQAFGADWEAHIPAAQRQHMLPRRYSLTWHPPAVEFINDMPIATHLETNQPILADLWQPPDPTTRNGVGIIYLHGSGWHYLKKDFYTRPFFRHLASSGYVVADVAYTMAPHATLLPMLADVYRAIAWMKTNADQLGIDPNRIVLIGGSAGAHLAMLAAYAPHHPELKPQDVQVDTSVRAVISYYGPGNIALAHEHLYTRYGKLGHGLTELDRLLLSTGQTVGRNTGFIPLTTEFYGPGYMIPSAFGGSPHERPLLYDIASPITHITPHSPPTLLLHGTHDFAIAAEQSQLLYKYLRKAGVKVVLAKYPYADHMFDIFFSPAAPAFQSALYDVERFLALTTQPL